MSKVREYGRITDKPQYIYLNIPVEGRTPEEYHRLIKMSPVRQSREIKSFEDYLGLRIAQWMLTGEGPLKRLGTVSDTFVIMKSQARGYLYLANMLHALIQGVDTDIASEYRVQIKGKNSDDLKKRAVRNLFKNLSNVGLDTKKIQLDEEGEVKVQEPSVEPIEIKEDVKVTAPETLEEYTELIEKDLLAEPITLPDDIKKFRKALDKNDEITINGVPLEKAIQLKDNEIPIPKKVLVEPNDIIGNRGMGESVLPNIDRHYIEHGADVHMMKVLNAFKPSGLVLTKVEREEVEDITGGFIQYKASFTLATGGSSTEIIRIPMVDKEGFFVANDTKYRMRRQAVDHPIRKIGPKRVSLSSYYGTLMIDGPKLAVDDKVAALGRKLKALELLADYNIIRNNVYDPRLDINDLYSRLSMEFERIEFKKLRLNLNFKYDPEFTPYKGGYIRVGKKGKTDVLLRDETFYLADPKKPIPVGDMFDLMELEINKKPVDVATMNILGTRVYVGVLLSYLYGITGLLKRLGVKKTIYPLKKRVERPLEPNILLKFSNGQLLLTNLSKTAEMILQGLVKYQDTIKSKSFADLDVRDTYMDIASKDLQIRHIREFNLLDKQFIDPITDEVLDYLGHPTWFRDLVIKAIDLLNTNHYPSSADANFTRYRGYERMAGATYTQISKHLRAANNAINRKMRRLGMSPFAVWQMIQEDDSNKVADETNPLGWMKEQEAVTVSGMNGRSSGTLTMEVRKFHPSMVGTIAEFTPDDGNVGMVSYLTANPHIDNIYGIPEVLEGDINKEYSRNYSSGFNFMPGIINDDQQ